MVRDRDYRTALDEYAESLLSRLVPDARLGVELIGARSPTKATYNLIMPLDHPNVKERETFHGTPIGAIRFAKPPELLDEEHAARYDETLSELTHEHTAMRTLREKVRERASDLPAEEHPSIWIPEVYTAGDEGFVRQFVQGKHVTSVADYSISDASHLLRDMLFVTEEVGMAGFSSVRNDLRHMSDHELETLALDADGLETELIHHHSPHVNRTVLSPTNYDKLVPSGHPKYFERQQRDFFDADGLRRLARIRFEASYS